MIEAAGTNVPKSGGEALIGLFSAAGLIDPGNDRDRRRSLHTSPSELSVPQSPLRRGYKARSEAVQFGILVLDPSRIIVEEFVTKAEEETSPSWP